MVVRAGRALLFRPSSATSAFCLRSFACLTVVFRLQRWAEANLSLPLGVLTSKVGSTGHWQGSAHLWCQKKGGDGRGNSSCIASPCSSAEMFPLISNQSGRRIWASDQRSGGWLVAGSPAETLQSTRWAQPCPRCSPWLGSPLRLGDAPVVERLLCAAMLLPVPLSRTLGADHPRTWWVENCGSLGNPSCVFFSGGLSSAVRDRVNP